MMRTVYAIVRDPDETADAFQNVLMFIWKNLEKIRRHPNPRGYILRACTSAAYDIVRARARRRARNVDMADSGAEWFAVSHGADAGAELREREILHALEQLPPQQAQALVLQLVDDEPYDKIAQALSCSEATARSHVSKGKARLRDLIAEQAEPLTKEKKR